MVRSFFLIIAWVFLLHPSPTFSQNNGNSEIETSHQRGYYNEPFLLEISSNISESTIFYTTNGDLPTSENAQIYQNPINITTTTILRTFAQNDTTQSSILTHTFLFLNDVIQQSHNNAINNDYPEEWEAKTPSDYEMDTEIVLGNETELIEALQFLPSVSIVTNQEHLFDDEDGIYMNTFKSGVDWERPTSIEMMDINGEEEFQVDCGLRIHGGASRNPEKSPKHSFRLKFKSEYAYPKLEYPLYGENADDTFDELVLRAGYGNSWIHFFDGHRNKAQYIQDEFARRTQGEMGHIFSHGRFVHLYLNGMYWGIYNLVERPEAHFAASYLGGDGDDYDALNSGDAVDGDGEKWEDFMKKMRVTPIEETYEEADHWIEMENYIDYMLLNYTFANYDWDHHNWYTACRQSEGSKFNFFAWDNEQIIDDPDRYILDTYNIGMPTEVWSYLIQNEDFRLHFSDRVQKHILDGGALSYEKNITRYMNLVDEIEPAIIAESARWGDYRVETPYTYQTDWFPNITNTIVNYFPQVLNYVLQYFEEDGWLVSLKAPYFSTLDTILTENTTLEIFQDNSDFGKIYYTLDGKDPHYYGEVYNDETGLVFKGMATVKARFRVNSTGEWSPVTEHTFYAPENYAPLQITEIMYNPPEMVIENDTIDGDEFEFIELYNSGTERINLTDVSFTDGIIFTFPQNSKIEAKEVIVLAKSDNFFEERYGFEPYGEYTGKLKNSGETIQISNPVGGIIDEVTYSDDVPWEAAADGNGYSLEVASTFTENNLAEHWTSTRYLGTPGILNNPDDWSYGNLTSTPFIVPFLEEKPLTFSENSFIFDLNGGKSGKKGGDLHISTPNIYIFPNPFTDFIIIQPRNGKVISSMVFNSLGQVVKIGFGENKIKVEDLNRGVYWVLVKWSDESGKIYNEWVEVIK